MNEKIKDYERRIKVQMKKIAALKREGVNTKELEEVEKEFLSIVADFEETKKKIELVINYSLN